MPKTADAQLRGTRERARSLMDQSRQALGRARQVAADARNSKQVSVNLRALWKLESKKK